MPRLNPLATESSKVPDNFDEWNRNIALELAAEEQIEMTAAHWEVIDFVRNHCQSHGSACSARLLLKAMTGNFKAQGGKRYLYILFPRGPVVQACKIAGIPLPAYSLDLSFGSVH